MRCLCGNEPWHRLAVKNQLTKYERQKLNEWIDRYGVMPILYAMTDHLRALAVSDEASREILAVLDSAEDTLRRKGY